jgi:hypothetical protein
VVDTALTRSRRRWAAVAAAGLAVGFMAAMVWSGREPRNRWLVTPEVAGVLAPTPDHVTRVEVVARGRRLVLVRGAGGWASTHGAVPTAVAAHVEAGLKFLHVSAPVRVLAAAEYRGTDLVEYGLAPPRYTVALFGAHGMMLEARFGARNPQDVLQYVRLGGHDEIHLMPRFVGAEWEQVIDGAAT